MRCILITSLLHLQGRAGHICTTFSSAIHRNIAISPAASLPRSRRSTARVRCGDHAALESPGDYEIEIRNALNKARAVVVIWTKEAGASDWVKSEAGRARHAGKLINVRAPGLMWEDLPIPFDRHHLRDFDDTDGILRAIAAVWDVQK
jgi:hypothetical protein